MTIEPNAPSNPSKIKKIIGTIAASIALILPFNSNAAEQNQSNLDEEKAMILPHARSNYEANVKDPIIYRLLKKINDKGFNVVEIEGKGRTGVLTLYNEGKPDTRFEPFPTKAGHKNALTKLLEEIEFEEKETLEIDNLKGQIISKGYKVLEIPITAKFTSLILYKDKNQIQDVNIRINDKKETLTDFLKLIEEKEDREKNEIVRYLYERGYELIETPKTKDYVSLRLHKISENEDLMPETIVKNQDRNNTLRYLINQLNKK